MAISYEADPNARYEDSNQVNAPCHAHLVIVDVDEDGMRLGKPGGESSMVVDFEVVAATDPAQIGMTHRAYFPLKLNVAFLSKNFAIAAGIKLTTGEVATADVLKKYDDAGQSYGLEFESSGKGCQVFADIDWDHYTDRNGLPGKSLKIQRKGIQGYYHIASKQCTNKTNWPRNETFINALVAKTGIKMPTATASAPSSLNGAHGPAAAMHGTKSPPASTPSALNGLSGALAGIGKPK